MIEDRMRSARRRVIDRFENEIRRRSTEKP